MKTYTVHMRTDDLAEGDAAEPVFVKDGFCWPALFFPLVWLLYRRMWLVLLCWLAIGIALAAAGELWPAREGAIGVVAVVFAVWFATEANNFRRFSLTRRGFDLVDVVSGRDLAEAELSHFRRVADGDVRPGPAPVARTGAEWPRRAARHEPVLGLFPEARR